MYTILRHSALACILVLTGGCSLRTLPLDTGRLITPQQVEQVVVQRGKASWYGPGFQGRRTASGEVFNTHTLTAAHPTLPFGTRVEVTNQATGKSVKVKINDRGPFVKGRIIDLSHAAAKAINMDGLAPVQIKIITIGDKQ